ncbi:MAG: heme exporter protein CcmD [Paracoccus sp. (in: a-proteobacteria)]
MIELGKYAGTVLSAYAVGLALLAGIVVQTIRASRKARAALEEHERHG